MKIVSLPTNSIKVPTSTRELRDIESLAQDIKEVGLLVPIRVDKNKTLRWGRRRLEACKLLGWTEIPCIIGPDDNDLKLEYAQLSENLYRDNGTQAEQMIGVARMKEVYEILHPETRQGGAPAKQGGGKKPRAKNAKVAPFAQDVAKKSQKGLRTVQRTASVGKALQPFAEKIKGTEIADSQSQLVKLAQLGDQALIEKVLDKIISNPSLNVAKALKELNTVEKRAQNDAKLPKETEAENSFEANGVRIVCGSFEEEISANLQPGSADLVIADLSSLDFHESRELCEKFSEVSAEVLKPGGPYS